jgi:hypothetical protein
VPLNPPVLDRTNPGSLLTPMLLGVNAEIRQFSRLRMRKNTEQTAMVACFAMNRQAQKRQISPHSRKPKG